MDSSSYHFVNTLNTKYFIFVLCILFGTLMPIAFSHNTFWSEIPNSERCGICSTLHRISHNRGECTATCLKLTPRDNTKLCTILCGQLDFVGKLHQTMEIQQEVPVDTNPCISLGLCPHTHKLTKASNSTSVSRYLPVVLMHGHASNAATMESMEHWIQEAMPGVYVKNVEIGDGIYSSIFTHLNSQVTNFCEQMKNDAQLRNGFNLIGFSQGTLITRAYIERCNDPPVQNWISLGSPAAGQFGLAIVPDYLQRELDWLLASTPYGRWLQNTFAFASYWRDPYESSEYLLYASFLPDINNELEKKNPTYRENLISLKNMVLVYSTTDEVIRPPSSGWFNFFNNDQDREVVPYNQTESYKEDWLGLRTLQSSNRLHLFQTQCSHFQFHEEFWHESFNRIVLPFLNSTYVGNLDLPNCAFNRSRTVEDG